MPESLIPEATRALIGEALNEPVSAVIVEKEAQRYAYAVDDLNPIYFDEAAAKAAGYRTLVAPPTYVSHVVAQHRPVETMRVDGIYRGGAARHRVELRVKRIMFGGEEWEFVAPAYIGDTITAVTRLHSLEEKAGGSGPFVLQTVETTYTNQDGEVVARGRTKSIAR
jgi:acyl dehydratase